MHGGGAGDVWGACMAGRACVAGIVCMARGTVWQGHAWYGGGGYVWQGGMRGRGVCVAGGA